MRLRTGLGGHGDDRITPRHACACTEDRRTCTSNPFAVSEQEEVGALHYNAAALPGKRPGAHFELRGRSGRALKISHQSEFEPRTLQPIPSRYSDYALPTAQCSALYKHLAEDSCLS